MYFRSASRNIAGIMMTSLIGTSSLMSIASDVACQGLTYTEPKKTGLVYSAKPVELATYTAFRRKCCLSLFVSLLHPTKNGMEPFLSMYEDIPIIVHPSFAGAGEQVAFDIFRFDADGKIAEHWDNLAAKRGPNPSGHTQTDGCDSLEDLDKTETNRELVKNFLHDVLQGKAPEKTPLYFDGDTYIQHNTGIADGLTGLGAALEALGKQGIQMVYSDIHQILAQGNYVLAVSEGTFGGRPTSYYDLWRVRNGKIAEHWDVMEPIADKETWRNQNGKF